MLGGEGNYKYKYLRFGIIWHKKKQQGLEIKSLFIEIRNSVERYNNRLDMGKDENIYCNIE